MDTNLEGTWCEIGRARPVGEPFALAPFHVAAPATWPRPMAPPSCSGDRTAPAVAARRTSTIRSQGRRPVRTGDQ
jgi:hypothetical protein